MITKISGQLVQLTDDAATIAVDAFEYQVYIPDFTRRHLQSLIGQPVSLLTIQYIDGNVQKGGRMTPRLVGFTSEIEREFFEYFCSVAGVGVKKALRAMVRPPQDVARAIEQQDIKSLATLPGIGASTAEKIVAALRRKMAKFALIVPREPGDPVDQVEHDIVEDTYQILLTLGHSELDARKQLERSLRTKKKFRDVDELLQSVYDNSNQAGS